MVSKPKSKKAFPSAKLKAALGSLGNLVQTAVLSHPVCLGLTVMTLAKVANITNTLITGDNTGPRSRDVSVQLEGLYMGAQAIALASAVIPVAIASVQAMGSIAAGALSPVPVPKKAE